MGPAEDDARRCTARSSRTGEPCKRWATPGTNVCPSHGAAAPQVRRRAAERIAEAKARTIAEAASAPPLTDPYGALMKLAGEVVALKDVLAGMVAEMRGLVVADEAGREQLRALVGAYERALDRSGRLLIDIGKLDIEERMMRISENEVAWLDQTLTWALDQIGVDALQVQRFNRLFANKLREGAGLEQVALDAPYVERSK